ncbi:MAG: DeoR/GlpR transcriptional regulator [Pirellulales bacterium]|nr:DeoR/GlpR transcriptional regulator [Pirellulales bacterium]
MLVEQRRNQLLELVRAKRFASLPELVEQLSVSESTIRRDLEYLEEQGAAKRIHGGVLYAGEAPQLAHFEQQSAHWEEKRAVARRAVELIEEGDSILLDGGSTTYEVARLLVGRRLHVVTNSLPVANLLSGNTANDVVLVGGNVCPRSGVMHGPLANEMITALRVRKVMLSVAGINDEGFFNNNLLFVETEQAMIRAADEVIVVADSSKFGRRSLTHVCRLNEVDHLVVDDGISDEWREKIIAAGVDLRIGCQIEHVEG